LLIAESIRKADNSDLHGGSGGNESIAVGPATFDPGGKDRQAIIQISRLIR